MRNRLFPSCLLPPFKNERNYSNENEFDLHENGHGSSETYYHLNGLARRLVLKQRQRANMVALFALLFSTSLHTNNKPPADLT